MAVSRKIEKNAALALQTHTTWVSIYFASAFMKTYQDMLFWTRAKTDQGREVWESESFDIIVISESFQVSTVKSQLRGTPQE